MNNNNNNIKHNNSNRSRILSPSGESHTSEQQHTSTSTI